MATLTITIPDDDMDRAVAALSAAAGFPDDFTEDHALTAMRTWVQQTISNVEFSTAQQEALNAVPPPVAVVVT